MSNFRKKTAIIRGTTILVFFIITGLVVYLMRNNIAYIYLFSGIGIIAGMTEFKIASQPEKAQIIRKISSRILASLLFILALIIGINFQFSQIFIDLYSGIMTGAVIQFFSARLILPFIFGNIFCSRACWDGALFEYLESKEKFDIPQKKEHVNYRSSSAWFYLIVIIMTASLFGVWWNLRPGGNSIRWTFILFNIAIIALGISISRYKGSRGYCRKLCPFITVSGIISQFSIFKVSPIESEKCKKCRKCISACPMHIDVMSYVNKGQRISHPDCIMCESCISICPEACLAIK